MDIWDGDKGCFAISVTTGGCNFYRAVVLESGLGPESDLLVFGLGFEQVACFSSRSSYQVVCE